MSVKIEGLELQLRHLRILERRLLSVDVKHRIGALAVELIYNRVKAGGGVDAVGKPPESTKRQSLKRLSPGYKKWRAGLIRFYTDKKTGKVIPAKGDGKSKVTGKFGSNNKSNLTLTGQMLEALGYKISGGIVYINVSNTLRSDGKSNKKIAEWVSEERPWLALTNTEFRILIKEADRIIIKEIRKLFS